MNRVPAWRRYLRFWGARLDSDVDRTRTTCLMIDYRRQRHMTRAQTIDAFAQDVRYAVRTLGRQKGWTTVALVTMALGIGASTAVFSAVNSTILNPLPYRDAKGIVMLWRRDPKSSLKITPSAAIIAAWTSQASIFDGLEHYGSNEMTLSGRGDAANVGTASVQPSFIAFTGLRLVAGRTFSPEETVPGGTPVAIISERLWRERFGGTSDVINQRVTLNDKPFTIIGIAPSRLRLPMLGRTDTDVWLPLVKDSLSYGDLTVARLRKGVSVQAATKQLGAIVANNHLDGDTGPTRFEVALEHPGEQVAFKSSLFLLSGAVALLLLVACANVAHLLLARGATRERELGIRAALGAGRGRIARQLLTESSLLAVAGCIGGVIVGYLGIRALSALRPESLAALAFTELDGRALWAAIAMSVFAWLSFGCTAAVHAVSSTTSDSLRVSATFGTGAPGTHRLRSLLVITEMAVSAMLLVGAALLVRSVVNLQRIDLGFDPHDLYALTLSLPGNHYPSSAERAAFIDRAVEIAKSLPGTVSVTTAAATPPGLGGFMMAPLELRESARSTPPTAMAMNFVAPNFFSVLRVHLDGRAFGPASVERNEVIVNRGMASTYWPGQSAVGKHLRWVRSNQAPNEDWMTVIGIADDVPRPGFAGDRNDPLLYKPMDRLHLVSRLTVAVRVRDGSDPAPALRGIVATLDPRLVPPPVTTVDADLSKSISPQRFTMVLLAVFAALAVVLSAVGLYGVISYVVTQRTREIGIRVTLGATPRNVAGAIVTRGLTLSIIGLAIGMLAATWGARLIKAALFGVTGTDPLSYGLAAIVLIAVSLVACTVPMRRAMRVDPVIAMRAD